ncbi:hypothetical protein [[Limnothrix rosea] IAM M-220]|uniref:hypothetical protein n=1 Tax=[Limnothrix rosea] IAM M-220 TaxID=454133 RepID=UPI00096455CB|nr:hypothetical protein [[Limnothrix rosea] IAM M-220]OKH16026.1 hypothetical protein NIES208_12215 [[Limnothrix rosea] IAM M-220]
MENISDFNKNIAVLYEKDSSINKTVAIKELLDCDEIGLEIVKRFVLDRTNRVSVRLLALAELWNHQADYKDWIITLIEAEQEYLFLQQDFLDFLYKNGDEQWLERLSKSQNQTLRVKASEVFLQKLHKRISQLNESVIPYQQSLEIENQKLRDLSALLDAEKREESRLYQEIEKIKREIGQLEERKQKLNLEISVQRDNVNACQTELNDIQSEKEREIHALQRRIQELSTLFQQKEMAHLAETDLAASRFS